MRFRIAAWLCVVMTLGMTLLSVAARPAQKSPKGMELYSWKSAQGGWVFALLQAGDRPRTEAEIKSGANQVPNTSELETRFYRLAEGEQITWSHESVSGFAFPDDSVIREIANAAKKANVVLLVPRRR